MTHPRKNILDENNNNNNIGDEYYYQYVQNSPYCKIKYLRYWVKGWFTINSKQDGNVFRLYFSESVVERYYLDRRNVCSYFVNTTASDILQDFTNLIEGELNYRAKKNGQRRGDYYFAPFDYKLLIGDVNRKQNGDKHILDIQDVMKELRAPKCVYGDWCKNSDCKFGHVARIKRKVLIMIKARHAEQINHYRKLHANNYNSVSERNINNNNNRYSSYHIKWDGWIRHQYTLFIWIMVYIIADRVEMFNNR